MEVVGSMHEVSGGSKGRRVYARSWGRWSE
jgi:hypothetical protein